jgi:signal transduction histidine kinase
MAHWGSFIFVLFLGYILEQRFADNRNRLETYARELEIKTKKLDEYSQELEQEVAERTKDLNRKNADLENTLAQLKEMQHQLITKEKMAMLGNLVAGIAHEVNNPIGVVNSAADVSSRCIVKIDDALTNSQSIEEVKSNSALHKTFRLLVDNNRLIVDASSRVSKLVSSLKNFALLDEAEYKKIDLLEGIDNTLTLLEHEFKDRIEVIKEYGDIPPVHCYASQINQVLMNLLKNASQAIEEKGTIHIKTTADEKNIFIYISDDGKGIPKDKLKTIFDIGFSASGSRVKMGSGLWTAHSIMHQHHGELKIESEVGKGTTVAVMLPLK